MPFLQKGVCTIIPNAVHAVLFLGHAGLNTVMVYTEPRLEELAERIVG